MKRFFLLAIILIGILQIVWAQTHFHKSLFTVGIQTNPHWVKKYYLSSGYNTQLETILRSQYGFQAEKYLNNRFGVHVHILYENQRFTDDLPPMIRYIQHMERYPNPVDTYRIIETNYHIGEIGISIRYYQQKLRAPVRTFVELGVGNSMLINGTSSQRPHPLSSFSFEEETVRYYLKNWFASVIANTGIQYRFANHWGAEFAMTSRLPITSKPWKSFQYGFSGGLNYYLIQKK